MIIAGALTLGGAIAGAIKANSSKKKAQAEAKEAASQAETMKTALELEKAKKDKQYTKEEINALIAAKVGAQVAEYTAKVDKVRPDDEE